MNNSSPESSLDGDESTVSSKSGRNRPLNANFSDMPSLASYRADEISIASTLWTDCDQSLPSLSSYRTKDLSISSSLHSRTNMMIENKFSGEGSSSLVSGTNTSNSSDAEDFMDDSNHVGRKRSSRSLTENPVSNSTDERGVERSQSFPLHEIRRPVRTSSKGSSAEGELAGSVIGGDSLPMLPRRGMMNDSQHTDDSEKLSDEESDISDDDQSPDVSIPTDSEHEDIHRPVHTANVDKSLDSPTRNLRNVRLNNDKSPVGNGKQQSTHQSIPRKIEPVKGMEPSISPPAGIETTPTSGNHRKSHSQVKEPDSAGKYSSPKSQNSIVPLKGGESPRRMSGDSDSRRPRPRRPRSSDLSKPRESSENHGKRRGLRRTASALGGFTRRHGDKQGRGVRRTKSSDASTLRRSGKKDEEKRGRFVRRLSSSLMHMVGNRSRSPRRGAQRNRSGSLSASFRDFASGTASKFKRGKRPEKPKGGPDKPTWI